MGTKVPAIDSSRRELSESDEFLLVGGRRETKSKFYDPSDSPLTPPSDPSDPPFLLAIVIF